MTAAPLAPNTSATGQRPATVTAAIALLIIVALGVLIPFGGDGGDGEAIPAAILVSGYVLAALKVVAAVGLWRPRKWAAILGFVAVLLDALTAIPGVFFAPTPILRVIVGIGLLLSLAILALLILPTSRRAYR
ncbi:MAG TPA: hypothetical protein VIL85_28090 [Thermomicrobiales bacterium]|jgi:hypothetical protein